MKHLMTGAAVIALLAGGTALKNHEAIAQSQNQEMKSEDMKKPSGEMKSEKQSAQTASSIQFVTKQEKSDWLSTDLIGAVVQNTQGETLGDINNVVFNEKGDIEAVIIGVGGFLGIGEKNVGVSLSALEFKRRTTAAMTQDKPDRYPQGRTTAEQPRGDAPQGLAERQGQSHSMAQKADPDRQESGSESAADSQFNTVVVLNASRDQLESAPAYTYLGQEPEAPAGSDQQGSEQKKSN